MHERRDRTDPGSVQLRRERVRLRGAFPGDEPIQGITDVCPSNASYMIRLDPDLLHPDDLISRLKALDEEVGDVHGFELETRIVDVPGRPLPWTHETLMRFRDCHQDPDAADLEYGARVNGYVFTPERAFGFGGSFAVVYPMEGAVGYQLFGLDLAPDLNLSQSLKDFRDPIVFPKPGDIFNYRRVDREEFDEVRAKVEDGPFEYRKADFTAGGNAVIDALSHEGVTHIDMLALPMKVWRKIQEARIQREV